MSAVTAYVALGANLGNRELNIQRALDLIGRSTGTKVVKVSKLLENPAVGGPDNAPAFLNAVAKIETRLSSRKLLERLLEIERELGRKRRMKWDPRTIDLDILLYGSEIVAEEDLMIPHPMMQDRMFVLQPLAQVAPGVVHPILGKTVEELLARHP